MPRAKCKYHRKPYLIVLHKTFKKSDEHACRTAVSRALKKWFADNAAKITHGMRYSFLDACNQINENNSNIESPSNHKLWKKAVASSELDFDWAAWIVLRIMYYDPVAKSQKPEDIKVRANLLTNEAAKKTRERYLSADIFTDQLPLDIEALRRFGWPRLQKKAPKDKDAVGQKSIVRKPPRSMKTKAQSEISDDEDQFYTLNPPDSREVLRQALDDESTTGAELAAALTDHLKNRMEDGYQFIPRGDDDKRPSKGELREWKQKFINATAARIHFGIEEAKKKLRKEWEQDKKSLLEKIEALEQRIGQ